MATQLRPILLGKDPLASEYLWDVMHRFLVHGRQGEAMFAISVVDCALWDLKGKWLGQPVWRLLGGPTRTEIPAYASMLGYAVLDPGLVRERALIAREQGYRAQKWFFRHGPMSGAEGLQKNVELVRTLREALGDDDHIMLDCWQSFDYRYLLELAARIEEFRPYWLEEPAMPDRIDTYRRLKDKIQNPARRRRARLYPLGHDALRRARRARRLPARPLLVRRPVRDPQDRGADHGPRSDLHPARPLDAGQRHLLGAPVADPHPVPGVSWSSGTRCISSGSSTRSSRRAA